MPATVVTIDRKPSTVTSANVCLTTGFMVGTLEWIMCSWVRSKKIVSATRNDRMPSSVAAMVTCAYVVASMA